MKKTAIPIVLLLLIGLLLLVACTNVSNETVTDTITIANLKSEVKSAFEKLTIASNLLIDSERGVISFSVENELTEIVLSEIKLSSGSFTVISSEGNALSDLTLNEGDNTFSLNATDGTITVTYTLKITRKSATSTDPIIDPESTINPEHIHTYSDNWSKDANNHWHAATCEHISEVKDKAEHIWGEGIVTTSPTEDAEGIRTYICTVCSFSKAEPIAKLAHTHIISTDWSKDSFYHWHSASCGRVEHSTDKASHTWDNGVITTPATEECEGVMSYLCTICGYTKTEPIEKLLHAHKYETEWTIDEYYHWHDATCGHDVTKDKAIHSWGNGSTIKDATEEETGIMFFVCSICGKTKEVVTPRLEHTHKYSKDWTSDVNYHWHVAICEHTEQISEKSTHIWSSGIVTEPATEEKSGIMTYSCTVCGKEKTEVIAQLPHTHTYETDWSCDETYHWHAANCEHTSSQKSLRKQWKVFGCIPASFAIVREVKPFQNYRIVIHLMLNIGYLMLMTTGTQPRVSIQMKSSLRQNTIG